MVRGRSWGIQIFRNFRKILRTARDTAVPVQVCFGNFAGVFQELCLVVWHEPGVYTTQLVERNNFHSRNVPKKCAPSEHQHCSPFGPTLQAPQQELGLTDLSELGVGKHPLDMRNLVVKSQHRDAQPACTFVSVVLAVLVCWQFWASLGTTTWWGASLAPPDLG